MMSRFWSSVTPKAVQPHVAKGEETPASVAAQLAFETGQQGGPRLGILAGLFWVSGQHITTPGQNDVLDGKVGLTLLAGDGQRS
jgi:hypothetical protein